MAIICVVQLENEVALFLRSSLSLWFPPVFFNSIETICVLAVSFSLGSKKVRIRKLE